MMATRLSKPFSLSRIKHNYHGGLCIAVRKGGKGRTYTTEDRDSERFTRGREKVIALMRRSGAEVS